LQVWRFISFQVGMGRRCWPPRSASRHRSPS
jgi:hypothetical protein